MNLFCGGKFSDRVSSEKLLAVSAAGPPAAFFPEIDMSGFFGHAHFGKKCDFAQIWSKYRPRYSKILSGSSQEALRRLSEGSQKALRILSGYSRDNPRNGRGDARGTNFGTSWELGITARTPTV